MSGRASSTTPGVRRRLALGATAFVAIAVAVSLLAGRWVIAVELDQADRRLVQADLTQVSQEYNLSTSDARANSRARETSTNLFFSGDIALSFIQGVPCNFISHVKRPASTGWSHSAGARCLRRWTRGGRPPSTARKTSAAA